MQAQAGEFSFYDALIASASDSVILIMAVAFVGAIVLRLLIYLTVARELWFVQEFEKRVINSLSQFNYPSISFFNMTKTVLQKTYYECFEMRLMRRRRYDVLSSITDRLFMIQEGSARIVMDFLRQARYLRHSQSRPKFLNVTKTVFEQNPVFGKLFGVFSISHISNLLNILPGLFIIGGIFGTFMGVKVGLPLLGSMDVADPASSKQVMSDFLVTLAYALNKSIAGIGFSVFLTVFYSVFAPENLYFNLVNKFTASMELLWNKADHNDLFEEDIAFVEARDKLDLNASDALKIASHLKIDKAMLSSPNLFHIPKPRGSKKPEDPPTAYKDAS